MSKNEWFGEWFDSPYYHVLYKHRDEDEAQAFIDRLINHLSFKKEDKILDLACGKGRHAIYLNRKGYNVVGLDLSRQNIDYARIFENERLRFYVHDMRDIWKKTKFDVILNLFTSFGYFDYDEENQQAIDAFTEELNPGGRLLIDFLNPYTVVHNLVPEEDINVEGINFHIRRYLNNDGYIIKKINFKAGEKSFSFQERVKAIRRSMFMEYFKNAGLELLSVYGDYEFNPYIAEKSERMIFLLRK